MRRPVSVKPTWWLCRFSVAAPCFHSHSEWAFLARCMMRSDSGVLQSRRRDRGPSLGPQRSHPDAALAAIQVVYLFTLKEKGGAGLGRSGQVNALPPWLIHLARSP